MIRMPALSQPLEELVSELKRLCGDRCQEKEHDPAKPYSNIDADHIVELQDGGSAFDPGNILLRCRSCHVAKTAYEKRARMEREHWQRRARETGGRSDFSAGRRLRLRRQSRGENFF